MPERAPFTDEELEAISEKLLDKMLKRLAKSVALPILEEDQNRDIEPTLDDYAALRNRRRRLGRK